VKLEKKGFVVLIKRCLGGAAGIARRQMQRNQKRSAIALRRAQAVRARNWLVAADASSALGCGTGTNMEGRTS